jgi:hypothetical protein
MRAAGGGVNKADEILFGMHRLEQNPDVLPDLLDQRRFVFGKTSPDLSHRPWLRFGKPASGRT